MALTLTSCQPASASHSKLHRAHAWRVDDREPPDGGQVAHFLVPVARMSDDVVYTCQTSGSSAPRIAWPSGSMSQNTSAAPCWTCRRCGGSRGRFVRGPSRAWLCPPRAEHCRRLLAQCRALRHVLGPHLGVIDGGFIGSADPSRVSQLPTHRRRLDHPARPHLPNLLLVRRHRHLTRATG